MRDKRCPTCTSGHGAILNVGRVRCPACNDEYGVRQGCTGCEGRGWLKCETCDGRGRVPDDRDDTDQSPVISLWGGLQSKKPRRRRPSWWPF